MTPPLHPYIPGEIWLCSYPVRYMGARFDARMSVIRLPDGTLMLHSPCAIDAAMKTALERLGEVRAIVAPGTYHYLHIPSAQAAFPAAKTWICPGLEKKRPGLHHDAILGDEAPPEWRGLLDQAVMRGNRLMGEVAFFHAPARTLLLVDLVENFTARTPDVNWQTKFWLGWVFAMWNRPRPAPEYQMGWRDKPAARRVMERILAWDFKRVILAHGDLINEDAHEVLRRAWARILKKPLAGG